MLQGCAAELPVLLINSYENVEVMYFSHQKDVAVLRGVGFRV
jgi:hypothetical protein